MTDYGKLNEQLASLIREVPYETASLANASALLFESLDRINWAGFYKMEGGSLVLGPFQGRPACIQIPVGRGVCGTAAAQDSVQLVKNVHEFPGHIACDTASNSEIVIPIHCGGRLWGVLDIDSPDFDRFSQADRQGLQQFAAVLETELYRMEKGTE